MIKILIVEDEKPISNLIKISLKNAGYLCDCAMDGEEAIEKIDEGIYDLILLDIMLPQVDGFELLQYIRPLEIPVIFLTAKKEVKDRVKGLRMGAEDYIVKPFEVAELIARVEVVLRRYKKNRRNLLYKWFDCEFFFHESRAGWTANLPYTEGIRIASFIFADTEHSSLSRDDLRESLGRRNAIWKQDSGSSCAETS